MRRRWRRVAEKNKESGAKKQIGFILQLPESQNGIEVQFNILTVQNGADLKSKFEIIFLDTLALPLTLIQR